MNTLIKDLRYGARTLFKNPGSAAIAVIAFSLGIGLCTIMFSLVYGVFFRGLDVPEPDRLIQIARTNLSQNTQRMGVTQHDYYDWRDQQSSFEGLGGYSSGTVNLSGTRGPERYDGGFVSANLFDLLRVRPIYGSGFRPGDDLPGAPLTVVLGYDVWATRYEGDPNAIGRNVIVNGEAATIVGVMPDGFMFPADQELWVVRRDQRGEIEQRGGGDWWSRVVGRLRDGVTFEQAELEMATIANRLSQEYTESNEGVGIRFITFVEDDTGPELIAVFGAMQVATIFVLLIACANVANLLLSRATLRTKEAAVRTALGANRLRVMFPFFSEALILSGVGALIGMGISYVGIDMFDRATTGVGKPYYMVFTIDTPILLFVIAVTALTALAAGAAPALQMARTDVNSVLKDEMRGSSSLHGGRLSKVLVTGEIALSCALLVGAGLMTKSIVNLQNYDFPFHTENVFTARVGLFETDYPDRAARDRLFRDLNQRLQSLPGAEAAALTNNLPGTSAWNLRFGIEGETYATDQDYPLARVTSITPEFFDVFGVQLLNGRNFSAQDDGEATEVAIVNQRFVERFFQGENPIGKRIREGTSESENEWKTIVGVAPNLRMEGLGNTDEEPEAPGYYIPLPQRDLSFMSLAVRARGPNALALTSEVRDVVRGLDPNLPLYNMDTLRGRIRAETWFINVFGTLFIVFGAAALFLASVGLYGVLAFSVSRRIKEMGIRMALGASAKEVIALVLRQGGMQLGVGLAIGLTMAFGLSRIVAILMFDVEPRDPIVFGSIALLIAIVGLVASFVPARRATAVDPIVALRYE